jgi:hypothetical protein
MTISSLGVPILDDRHPLIQVSESVRERAKTSRALVVFDLDSTLFCVSPRSQAILRTLAADADFLSRFPREAEILKTLEVLPTDWGVRSAILRRQISNDLDFFTTVRDYWRKHFFSSHFLEHDEIYPAAPEYVCRLSDLGAEIRYLTGRSRHLMEEGTLKGLRKWNFPLADPAHLLMKPSDVETDESFKALMLQELVKEFDYVWLFENEPVIIDLVRQIAPQVQIVFVNSVHSGRAAAPTDLLTILPDFKKGI